MSPNPGNNPASRRRGVVMVMAILSLLLLSALVFYVLNLGQQVNQRVIGQNAADASAKAGAAWIARSLNTIASNNVGIARYLAAVGVMDSLPQSVQYANKETKKLRDALGNHIGRGVGTFPQALEQLIIGYYQDLYARLQENITQMDPVEDFFAAIDVSEATYFSKKGGLWRGIYAMDEMNLALKENLGAMAQAAAVSGGQANISDSSDSDSMMLPIEPAIPMVRGAFDDFKRPIMLGRLPDAGDLKADDPMIGRGPFDAVFGWRIVVNERLPDPGGGEDIGDSGDSPGGLTRGAGGGRGGPSVPKYYFPYGTYSWLLNIVRNYQNRGNDIFDGGLQNTRLDQYLRYISWQKMVTLFPDAEELAVTRVSDEAGNLRLVVPEGYDIAGDPQKRLIINHDAYPKWDPDWRIDYEEAKSIAEQDRFTPRAQDQIKETAVFIVEIKSRYARTDSRFLTPGSWTLAFPEDSSSPSPRVEYHRGWTDPATAWGNVTKLNGNIWRKDWQYTRYSDPSIGITTQYVTDADNASENRSRVRQTIYRIDHIAFGGVNVGPPADVLSPFDGFTRDVAPIDLDHARLPQDGATERRTYLSFLGLNRRGDKPVMWPARFQGGRPYPNMVAIAQARVFNNHSWDLWTQMWHAQLEPVSDFGAWVQAMDVGGSSGGAAALVDTVELGDLKRYFTAATPLAELMLGH